MADTSTSPPIRRRAGRRRDVEFQIYFTLIFLFAIPFGVERWIAHAVRKRSLDVRGPLARAWAEADRITPILFTIR